MVIIHVINVNKFIDNGVIKSESVKKAMLAVDRGFFAPSNPYSDR